MLYVLVIAHGAFVIGVLKRLPEPFFGLNHKFGLMVRRMSHIPPNQGWEPTRK